MVTSPETEPSYVELCAQSHLSFLQATAAVEDLIERAVELGYAGLAITEDCSLISAPRAHVAAREKGLKLILGSRFRLVDGQELVLLVQDISGYAALARLITLARGRAGKGEYRLEWGDLPPCPGLLAIFLPDWERAEEPPDTLRELSGYWGTERLRLGLVLRYQGDHSQRLARLRHWTARTGIRGLACGAVTMARRRERFLLDVLTAIRRGRPLSELGFALAANGEAHLRSRAQLAAIYPRDLLAETLAVAASCDFSLDRLQYRYPPGSCPPGQNPEEYLKALARAGLARRYLDGVPEKVARQLEEELRIVHELDYGQYFLTVHEIVHFAKSRGILCQGRGSAANSVLCYALGITEVDPARSNLLFSRFLSRERGEPPDIDVDFEHERREEVIQFVFARYGRRHAALTASIRHYRPRSALRDAARALGFSAAEQDALGRDLAWWDGRRIRPERLQEAGFDPESPAVQRLLVVANALVGLPRHLSQHVGGMVLSAEALDTLVPIEPARMAGRTVIQWDKNDLDLLGILKVDLLALGMLSVLRRALDDLGLGLEGIPPEDPAVYAMLQRGESLGVFQVESRAQMSMLPRLKPRCFYDLVIEVAIIRPGPIQGGMVHPYLRRREGVEAVHYPGPEVRRVLERTLGVPIFQEQVMQIAMEAAGFDADAADGLRRAMAAWRRHGNLGPYQDRLRAGLQARGYDEAFARQLCQQIQGFAEYGFPESHAASFALLVYASAWIKCHHPAVFCAALLNSQPMGFYAPAQIVAEARERGVQVLPLSIRHSVWESRARGGSLRLGFHQLCGLPRAVADRIVAWREQGGSLDPVALVRELGCPRAEVERLARAGAWEDEGQDRRQSLWQVAAVREATALPLAPAAEPEVPLAATPAAARCRIDYAQLGLSLGPHPLHFLRQRLQAEGYRPIAELLRAPAGGGKGVAGLVTHRQRPATAHGTVFLTLEDESGRINVIVWPSR
ncbi:MAG: error-prone DNA polymerase, partial [Acidithiobacillus sp.]